MIPVMQRVCALDGRSVRGTSPIGGAPRPRNPARRPSGVVSHDIIYIIVTQRCHKTPRPNGNSTPRFAGQDACASGALTSRARCPPAPT
jgi:hypothetical protein